MIIVYVESNFVLELVLEQEEFYFCQQILELSSQKKIKLVLPAYSLVEPNEKLIRNARQRKQIYNNLKQELMQLKRSKSYKKYITNIDDHLEYLLIKSEEKERRAFQQIQKKLIEFGEIIPLNVEIIKKIHEENIEEFYNLSPQDAVVFCSIMNHLKKLSPSTSYFLNKNSKDFIKNLDILEILKDFNCQIISTFNAGYHRILSHLKQD
ncbi:PIN domain-containing protein [Cyanobacterium aponinum UTEX 3222]|uniref:PIN domain-containing protein n=1 Tax=Cyanobacterium aponinum TaxID=379064 RepID=UPI00308D9C21|nr:PIN domain-containing protein [Cyanobacterium aponinum UTEX 3222]